MTSEQSFRDWLANLDKRADFWEFDSLGLQRFILAEFDRRMPQLKKAVFATNTTYVCDAVWWFAVVEILGSTSEEKKHARH